MRRPMAAPWHDDLGYSKKEVLKVIAGSVVVLFVMWAVVALIALAPVQ